MVTKSKTTSQNGEALFSEAPASWNTRYIDPNGFECQLTLRCDSGKELLERAAAATSFLLENGCEPYIYARSSYRPTEPKTDNQPAGDNGNNGSNPNPSWCPIHHCEMRRFEKEGRSWYSHKTDGGWCKGK